METVKRLKRKRKPLSINDPIRRRSFFCGCLPRNDTESLLTKNGQFLVRVTDPKFEHASPFVITVRAHDGTFHVVILQSSKKLYHLEGPHFRTVDELISHYVSKALPLTKESKLIIKEGIKKVCWIMHDSEIEPVEKMGEGHFGEVWKVELICDIRKKTTICAAVKVLKSEAYSESERKEFIEECRKMRALLHPNVVLFYGIVVDVEPIKLVMELCDISLAAYLKDKCGQVTTVEKLRYTKHIAQGMEYITSKQFIHRDLALRNCLLKNRIAKIADFGQSKRGRVYKMKLDTDEPLPVMWIPPDTLDTRIFSEKSDVWAFGITIWELFSDGRQPYDELSPKLSHEDFAHELMHIVTHGYRMEAPPEMPSFVKSIMQKCWAAKAEDRPTFKQICYELGL
uniref:Tyrosine-protein kinase n=1 Tax=Trichuris muris TaxID=70415 RepID=A0A5S6QIE9_TRIMR